MYGGPEGTRTLDLSDANRTLSQTELQAHIDLNRPSRNPGRSHLVEQRGF